MLDAGEYAIRDDQAYVIQRRVRDLTQSGKPTVGFKLGYTSQAMRDAMGITSPNFGPLFDAMVCESPAVIGSTIPLSADEVDVTIASDSGGQEVARVHNPKADVQSAIEWLLGSPELSRPLREGDVIFTGGLSAPLDLVDHGWIEARFSSAGWQTSVRVERQEQP